ncbi:MAG TPA: type II and III secretion system protein family protein [Vicinamibacterales bacterium]
MEAVRRTAARVTALALYIIVILVATPQAQQPVAFSGSPNGIVAGPPALASDPTAIDLLVGRSTILNVGSPIARVSLTVADVADALVTSPQQLLIHGKTPGTISLFVWDRSGGIKTYEVNVRRDLKQLVEQMTNLFPGEPITVAGSGKDVVLSGTVTSKYVIDKAADVASGYVEKKENVVNLLKQQEGIASNQVMLRVRFAEVSRSALQEIGVNLFTGPTGYKDVIARTTTQQFSAPGLNDLTRTADTNNTLTGASGSLSLSDLLNVFVFSNKYNVGLVVRALQEHGVFQSLAEPNLISSNGKEASFLAGGEYPYPIVQPGSGGNAVTIQFKEYGVRLTFTPTVLNGDLISLKVKPEVSSLDFGNGLTLSGFRVPALSTRRTETELELQDGQTFAIAGLMNNNVSSTMSKIPGIGDIPILGYLFKSRAYQKQQTELVVMITPTIVRRGSTGVSEGLPNLVEPFINAPSKPMPPPPPYTGSPRYPTTQQPSKPGGAPHGEPTASSQAQAQTLPAPPPPPAVAAAPQGAAALPTAAPVAAAQTPPDPPAPLTKQDREKVKHEEAAARKAAEVQKAADKKVAQQKAADDKKAAADKVAADKKAAADKADADKKTAQDKTDADKKAAAEVKKQEKAVADAAVRLRDAQTAYEKTKGQNQNDK